MATATKASTNGHDAASQEEVEKIVKSMSIPKLMERKAVLEIKGISPLISHRWSEKAMKMMEDKQTGKATGAKEHRDPEAEALAAAYVVPGREDYPDAKPGKYNFPASAFKHAYLYGVAQLSDKSNFPKSLATGWMFVYDDPILNFEACVMRSDVGRIGMGTSTPVYRPQFNGWSCELPVTYNTLSLEQLVALLDRGGRQGGIGEWRPSAPKNKTGSFGRFEVASVLEDN